MTDKDVQYVWDEYWKPLVTNADGEVDLELVKAELYDFQFMLREVPKVYSAVTGHTLSKPNYYASSVIGVFQEYVEQRNNEAIEDFLETYGIEDPRK